MNQERKKITIAEEDIGRLVTLKMDLKRVHELQKQVFPGLMTASLRATNTEGIALSDSQLTKLLDLLEADIKSSIADLISAP
jgi:hypothetical protein